MSKLTDEQIAIIREEVRRRDKLHCVLCGASTKSVHEIIPRSHGGKNSSSTFKKENMVCLCNNCHMRLHFSNEDGVKKEMTRQIKMILRDRHSYFMREKL